MGARQRSTFGFASQVYGGVGQDAVAGGVGAGVFSVSVKSDRESLVSVTVREVDWKPDAVTDVRTSPSRNGAIEK
ncbi:MAG: hypothetical protein Q8T13_19910 [Acidobacteriota bacterium]|nr:hypothetical protein [Acidobacteriota bacterium]